MKHLASMAAVIGATTLLTLTPAQDARALTGTQRLACEAILCLSTGTRPSECAPSISHYFGISLRRFSDTIRERRNFLNLCPAANYDTNMQSLVSAISNGAGRCDASSLNRSLRYNAAPRRGHDGQEYDWRIGNTLPQWCRLWNGHQWVDNENNPVQVKYVGVPERGGYWVESRHYDAALVEYNRRIAQEDAERERQDRWHDGGGR